MRHLTRTALAALGATALVAVSACADTTDTNDTTDSNDTAGTTAATDPTEAVSETTTAATDGPVATISDADGTELGTVQFTDSDGGVEVTAALTGMEPGFYGFHLHGNGVCETDSAAPDDPADTGDFLSAGGHLGGDEADHPDHAGDLPQLLVRDSGDASLTFLTDRVTLADLEDEDGTAVIIHADPDNYANIPERYAPDGPDGPDEDTTGAGDAGTRLACGVVGR